MLDDIKINYDEPADTGACQIFGYYAAKASRTGDSDARFFQKLRDRFRLPLEYLFF